MHMSSKTEISVLNKENNSFMHFDGSHEILFKKRKLCEKEITLFFIVKTIPVYYLKKLSLLYYMTIY